jgi:uncharacterized protein (TIGR03435 family)
MKFVCILMLLITVLVLAPVAQSRASDPEQRFEAAVVKRYDHRNDRNIPPLGVVSLFGCYLGPGRLQYNCSDSVPRLVAEALNLSRFQFEEAGPPEYVITAKLPDPAPRQQMNDMLACFLQEHMGVRYHLEKKPIIKAEFLTVASQELLEKLPVSHDPVPLALVSSGSSLGWAMIPDGQFCEQRLGSREGESQVSCKNINFHLLAQILRRFFGVPVIDETGLTIRFDLAFTSKIDPEEPWNRDYGRPAWNLSEIRQLLGSYGISLQRRDGVTDFLVIDRVADEATFLN